MTLDAATLRPLVAGVVLAPQDAGFADAVAAWELAVVSTPALAVIAATEHDVVATVRWAVQHGLPVAVQSTGHGALAPVTAGVLINTSRLARVDIDVTARRARAQAGARWADVFDAAVPHGLVGVAGASLGVGVVGYTLGGGLSPIGRTVGLAADHVHAVDLVTADGEIRRVDAGTDPDLFWAIRGGGGGFGIVTGIEFDLIPLDELFGGGVFYDGADAEAVLSAYRDWVRGLDERTTTSVSLIHLPPVPQLEPEIRGRFVVHLRVAHVDSQATDLEAEARAVVAPMLGAGRVLLDTCAVISPMALASIHRDRVDPTAACYRGASLADLDGEAVELLVAGASPASGPAPTMVELRHLGGAIARHLSEPNCASGRTAPFNLFVTTADDPEHPGASRAVVDGVVRSLDAHRAPGAQLNFLGPAGDGFHPADCWSSDDARRLRAVKARIDPHGVFAPGAFA